VAAQVINASANVAAEPGGEPKSTIFICLMRELVGMLTKSHMARRTLAEHSSMVLRRGRAKAASRI
jgi:hypothetical protein